jgi:hypothetical protein
MDGLMSPDQTILGGGAIIITFGFANALANNRPKTPVFIGGLGVLSLASLLAFFGEGPAKLAAGFIMVAVVTVILVEGGPFLAALGTKGKKS